MLLVAIELRTPRGERKKLAEAKIYNIATTAGNRGAYRAKFKLDGKPFCESEYAGWPRDDKNVWALLGLLMQRAEGKA